MTAPKRIQVADLVVSNDGPFTLFGGMNAFWNLENSLSRSQPPTRKQPPKLGIPYAFKASFDKANRSSISSFRGPGLEKGLEILSEIKETHAVPVISDAHEPHQAKPAAEIIDALSTPHLFAARRPRGGARRDRTPGQRQESSISCRP